MCNTKIEVLPDDLGNFVKLESFYCWTNRIRKLPDSIAEWHLLQKLDIAYNKITVCYHW